MSNKIKIVAIAVLLYLFVHISYTTIAQDFSTYITVFTSSDYTLDISAKITTSAVQNTISAYYDDTDSYYLFLPAYAKSKKVILEAGDNIEITSTSVDGTSYIINQDKQLHLLYGTQLPSLHLTLENDLSYITADKQNTDLGQASFINTNGSIIYSGALEEIKGRGNNSWNWDKKPFNITLSHPISFQKLPMTSEFSLIATNDNTFLRNYISKEMSNAMNAFTLECCHLNLYINGEYQGVYELWNRISPDSLGIKDLENENKSVTDTLPTLNQLTSGQFVADWTQAPTGMWWDFTEASTDITGGYIIEADYSYRYLEEASGLALDSGVCMVVKSPKYISEAQYQYLRDYLNRCEDVMYESVGLDTYDALEEYIDIDSFITKYLVEEVSKNVDCSSTSQYFYKDANSKLHAGPVWDYNAAYCNGYITDSIDFDSPEGFSARNVPGSLNWWQLLYYNKAFYRDMTYVYSNTLYPYLNTLTDTLLPQWEAILIDSATMDAIKWKRATSIEAARTTYHNEVTVISDFLKARKEFLYNEWN